MSGPELFGLSPGDEGYDTFDRDFPESGDPVSDYAEADFEMGQSRNNGPVNFPKSAAEEQAGIDAWLQARTQEGYFKDL